MNMQVSTSTICDAGWVWCFVGCGQRWQGSYSQSHISTVH